MPALAATILATLAAWLVAPASAEGPAGEPVGFVSGLRYLAPALALALALLPVALQPRLGWLAASDGHGRDFGRASGGEGAQQSARRLAFGLTGGRALAAVALLALFAGGFALQRHYLASRYAEPDFATPALNRAFAAASEAPPAREGGPPLAVTSTRIYPFFGPDLKRPVAFVGLPEPHGGFRRPETCAEWRSAVNATGAERLIVAWDRLAASQPPLPPEAAWIASDPAADPVSVKGGAAVFALSGRLDPATCP